MKWQVALIWCVCMAAADPGDAADVPRLYFSKSFPGSTPAYVAISVDKTGAGDYREEEKDDNPLRFQLNDADAAGMFDLAAKLGYFDHPLESPLKVAFMGTKTFRFVDGARKNEVKFNYSEDPAAQVLADWFERISESEQLLVNLEVSAKYDRLGVMKAVLLLESAYDHKRLVDPSQYLPLLDRIAKNEVYMHQARLRAAGLADQFRCAATPCAVTPPK
ncbi:MAG TPA: hypothetical protein VN924_24055 [Bryobacteraceae bacterium]|jgi:hypothetical protein|nr:hypothetical protein [Bryobacteraceae bacterium]